MSNHNFDCEHMCDRGIEGVLRDMTAKIREKFEEFGEKELKWTEDMAYALGKEFERILDDEVDTGADGIFGDTAKAINDHIDDVISDKTAETRGATMETVEEWYEGARVHVSGRKLVWCPGRQVFVDIQLRKAYRLVEDSDMIVCHDNYAD